ILVVGPEEEEYTVHCGLLCHYSSYFRNLFFGPFQERNTLQGLMPDVSQREFRRCAYYCLPLSSAPLLSSYSTSSLLRLYVIADRYNIPLLRDDIVTWMFHQWAIEGLLPAYPTINSAFARLPANSPLCRLMVDVM
ncbi:hypothetical protein BKA66DRAFT_377713, partial [Pyrenochaeta sp. MPI-SDFR-AT-0127]